MPIPVAASATDLLLPRPGAGEVWDPHTIHTYYFGFSIPEVQIGVMDGMSPRLAEQAAANNLALRKQALDEEVITELARLQARLQAAQARLAQDEADDGAAIAPIASPELAHAPTSMRGSTRL